MLARLLLRMNVHLGVTGRIDQRNVFDIGLIMHRRGMRAIVGPLRFAATALSCQLASRSRNMNRADGRQSSMVSRALERLTVPARRVIDAASRCADRPTRKDLHSVSGSALRSHTDGAVLGRPGDRWLIAKVRLKFLFFGKI